MKKRKTQKKLYHTGTHLSEQKNSQFHIDEMLSITAVAIFCSLLFLQQSVSAFFIFIPTQHSFQSMLYTNNTELTELIISTT